MIRREKTPTCRLSPEESHIEAGHYESVVYLRLWSGDLEGALQHATEKGELNDHLLSIAPMGKQPLDLSQKRNKHVRGGFVSIHNLCCGSSPSRVHGVERRGGRLRQAAVSAGAVPEGSVPPAVPQQAVRGRRPAALSQALQVRCRLRGLLLNPSAHNTNAPRYVGRESTARTNGAFM